MRSVPQPWREALAKITVATTAGGTKTRTTKTSPRSDPPNRAGAQLTVRKAAGMARSTAATLEARPATAEAAQPKGPNTSPSPPWMRRKNQTIPCPKATRRAANKDPTVFHARTTAKHATASSVPLARPRESWLNRSREAPAVVSATTTMTAPSVQRCERAGRTWLSRSSWIGVPLLVAYLQAYFRFHTRGADSGRFLECV